MKRILGVLLSILLLISAVGCGGTDRYTSSFYGMDTLITVTLYGVDSAQGESIVAEGRRMLTELESLWSKTLPESEVSEINAAETVSQPLDTRTVALLLAAFDVYTKTEGAFDPTVAPLISLWETAGETDCLPSEDELAAAIALVGFSDWTLSEHALTKPSPQAAIDLGGIGKGAAISALLSYLESTEADGGLVSFGSNVAVFGQKPNGNPFRVAIRDPREESGTVGGLVMHAGEILSVSGDYERYVTVNGEHYHHLLHPKTGYPADGGLASVAVIARDGALADALSTALFVMGKDAAMAFCALGVYDFEAILIEPDGSVFCTDGLAMRFESV